MSSTLSGGTVSAPINSGSVVPEAPVTTESGVQPGMGEGAPQNSETGVDPAGVPQGNAEGGQSDGGEGQSRRSRQLLIDRDEILGLRNDRRQLRSQLADMQAMLEELRAGGSQPQPNPGATKTEQDFFANPDSRFQSLEEKLDRLEERITDRVSKQFQSVRQQDSQAAQLNQERSEAVKLVHSQAGWDPADDTALIDIIEEYGLGTLPPLKGAETALALFYRQKGIGDKSQAKARAASIVGAPGGAGGTKIWPKSEVERLLDQEMRKAPDKMNQELIEEIKLAQAENRIR